MNAKQMNSDNVAIVDTTRQGTKSKSSRIHQDKWCKLLTNFQLWVRILILILSICLLFLCTSYYVAQLLEAKLDLITECPEPVKTREEIWRHSYESSLKYPPNETINYETQYGLTDEPCWTTKN